ncbi:hypothetical protein EYC84_003712 [Monilinia fructicola]|uniref:Uncharacterized protein n=1 Tax=Monilinia fructicola TaxID=38448 RepID=A0A5M9JYI0_MONFR|nr:hypothetical protein EYC84_003712 [Monilinia fructicola]
MMIAPRKNESTVFVPPEACIQWSASPNQTKSSKYHHIFNLCYAYYVGAQIRQISNASSISPKPPKTKLLSQPLFINHNRSRLTFADMSINHSNIKHLLNLFKLDRHLPTRFRDLLHLFLLRPINNRLDINYLPRSPLLALTLPLHTLLLPPPLPLNLILPRILLPKILDIRILSAVPHHNGSFDIGQVEQRFPRLPHDFIFVQFVILNTLLALGRPKYYAQRSWVVEFANLARPGCLERLFEGGPVGSDEGFLHFGVGIEEYYRFTEVEVGDLRIRHDEERGWGLFVLGVC